MSLKDWQGKDHRERTPFDYQKEDGSWFQTRNAFKLYDDDGAGDLELALLLMAEIPDGLQLFLFGQDNFIEGEVIVLYPGVVIIEPTVPVTLANENQLADILGHNAITPFTYLTASKVNWGHRELVTAETVTNQVAVYGWLAESDILDRGFLAELPDVEAPFIVRGKLTFDGAVVTGLPYNYGAAEVGEEEAAVTRWVPAIIPEALYTDAIKLNNNFVLDSNGNTLYVVGLWQNIVRQP